MERHGADPSRSRSRSPTRRITEMLQNLWIAELAREARQTLANQRAIRYQDHKAIEDYQHWSWKEDRWWQWYWNQWWTPWVTFDEHGKRSGTFWYSWTSWTSWRTTPEKEKETE